MLEALQVVLITAGQGRLELRDTRPQIITAGSAFVFSTRLKAQPRLPTIPVCPQ